MKNLDSDPRSHDYSNLARKKGKKTFGIEPKREEAARLAAKILLGWEMPLDEAKKIPGVRAVFGGLAASAVDLDAHGSLALERSGSAILHVDTAVPTAFVGPRGAGSGSAG